MRDRERFHGGDEIGDKPEKTGRMSVGGGGWWEYSSQAEPRPEGQTGYVYLKMVGVLDRRGRGLGDEVGKARPGRMVQRELELISFNGIGP